MPNTIEEVAKTVAEEFIQLVDTMTTSDLQGCIGAAVIMKGLTGNDAFDAECKALDLIYEAIDAKGGYDVR
jgi:hypothetical protein